LGHGLDVVPVDAKVVVVVEQEEEDPLTVLAVAVG